MEEAHCKKAAQVIAVMVPLPAQSHMQQLLQCSLLLVSHNIPVHYVGSSTHNHQLKNRLQLSKTDLNKIQFHNFPVPDTTPLDSSQVQSNLKVTPDQYHAPMFEAYVEHLRSPVAALLRELAGTAKRVVVVHDQMVSSSVQDAASIPNAETYVFHTSSCIYEYCSFRDSYEENFGRPWEHGPKVKKIPNKDWCNSEEMKDYGTRQYYCSANIKAGDIYNTCRFIEGIFVDSLATFTRPEIKRWAIGPVNPIKASNPINGGRRHHRCFDWLDKQEPRSVLYVSFGTTTNMEDEQVKELALGLEQSKVKFLWVLRDFDKGNSISSKEESNNKGRFQLPKGFETRIEEQGMVVREWTPQLEVLSHNSIGGFMSHCGWASCMESLSLGVPMATWPMQSDQPYNELLLTEFLKVGISVRKWEKKDELVTASAINEVARKLIESEEGEKLRKNADELGRKMQQCVLEGGPSHVELEAFIAHIIR